MARIRFDQDGYDASDPWQTGQMNIGSNASPSPAPTPAMPDYLAGDERLSGGYTGTTTWPSTNTSSGGGGVSTSPGTPVATGPASSAPSLADAVAALYKLDLGRAPENTDVINQWIAGTGGNYDAISRGIYSSPEAVAYRARPASGASGSGLPSSGRTYDDNAILAQIKQWSTMPGADPSLASNPAYWLGRIKETGGLGADNAQYWQDAGVGPTAFFRNPGREGANNVGAFGYDDPSSLLYLSSVLNRLQQLAQPRHDPAQDQLAQMVQDLIAKSQQAPYTAGDDAALIARYREPLTQARDAELRRNREQASQRGFLPSSGLLRRMDTDVSNSYIRGIAQASNDLGVRAVDEQRNRLLQALQALSGLVANNRTEQDRQDAVRNQIVELSALFPQFDERRLATLLNASGDNSAGSAISGLTSLGNLGLNASRLNTANSAGSASAWGQILGWILENAR